MLENALTDCGFRWVHVVSFFRLFFFFFFLSEVFQKKRLSSPFTFSCIHILSAKCNDTSVSYDECVCVYFSQVKTPVFLFALLVADTGTICEASFPARRRCVLSAFASPWKSWPRCSSRLDASPSQGEISDY